MATSTKTQEKHVITEGDFTLIATIGTDAKITLEKPDGTFGGMTQRGGKRDYHFEQSSMDKVEQFAKCALEAVRIAKTFMVPNPNKKAKKTKK